MKWLETVEAQEDNILSFNQATTLINKYGDDLDGLFGMTSVATPASAEAVTQAGLCGKVAVVGLATPNAMKPYVESDCVKSVVLWNPVDLGYAAVYVMRAVVDGKLTAGATAVEAGRLGKLQVVNGSEILLGPPFVYTQGQHRRLRLLRKRGLPSPLRGGCHLTSAARRMTGGVVHEELYARQPHPAFAGPGRPPRKGEGND